MASIKTTSPSIIQKVVVAVVELKVFVLLCCRLDCRLNLLLELELTAHESAAFVVKATDVDAYDGDDGF